MYNIFSFLDTTDLKGTKRGIYFCASAIIILKIFNPKLPPDALMKVTGSGAGITLNNSSIATIIFVLSIILTSILLLHLAPIWYENERAALQNKINKMSPDELKELWGIVSNITDFTSKDSSDVKAISELANSIRALSDKLPLIGQHGREVFYIDSNSAEYIREIPGLEVIRAGLDGFNATDKDRLIMLIEKKNQEILELNQRIGAARDGLGSHFFPDYDNSISHKQFIDVLTSKAADIGKIQEDIDSTLNLLKSKKFRKTQSVPPNIAMRVVFASEKARSLIAPFLIPSIIMAITSSVYFEFQFMECILEYIIIKPESSQE